MGKGGGTNLYCPYCKEITVCKVIPPREFGQKPEQRWYFEKHPDVHGFRRVRICLSCNFRFVTSEVHEDFLNELVQLRNSLGSVRKNINKYSNEASQTASTLDELSQSLQALKALKMYNQNET